jgi:hypothetical protein
MWSAYIYIFMMTLGGFEIDEANEDLEEIKADIRAMNNVYGSRGG